jgi:hypothetical protein
MFHFARHHYLSPTDTGAFYSKAYSIGIMDFELHPTVCRKERSFNVLIDPREHFKTMLNCNLNLNRYKVLFITGNNSGILSRLCRRFAELEIRRGFTTFQLMTILEEAYHSMMIIEHDSIHIGGLSRDGRIHLTGRDTDVS